jgi:hypothetical protein
MPAATAAAEPSLFDGLETESEMDARFWAYDRDNPQVYAEFRRIARELLGRGVTHYGAKAIMEIVRYRTVISGNDGFKCNNNFTSRFARKLASEDERFADFFEFRELRS